MKPGPELVAELRRDEERLAEIRRDLHSHPELAYQEQRTSGVIADELRSLGIEVATGVGRTGVVGSICGRAAGGAIGLRADMDALRIDEQTRLPYASRTPGIMHACGHDGHTTMLLGAARYLSHNPDFAGTVHLLFQPAEEGGAGARAMLDDGLLERFPCDAFFAMHNHGGMPVGQFGTRAGPMLAAADNWTVTFHGTGGGSAPHLCTDPTVPHAHFVLALQGIIGRNVAATEPALINVGHISAGAVDAPNVIPSTVTVRGTARSFRAETRALIERRLQEVAIAVAAMHGCTATCEYDRGYPPVINDALAVADCLATAISLVGAANVQAEFPPMMAAEDFAYLLERKPGAMMMIGNGVNADGSFARLHTPHYDFNDKILALGAAYWVSLVARRLANGNNNRGER